MSISAKLSDLQSAGTLAGGELIYVVQGGNSRQATLGKTGVQLMQDTGATAALQTLGLTAGTIGHQLWDDTGQTAALVTLGSGQKIRDYIDPLKDFNADGATDDTANFTALRVLYPDTDFDLKGKTYRVTSLPNGPFHNGYFKINDYEGQLDAQIMARDTIRTVRTVLTTGSGYAAWCQDTWRKPRFGVVHVNWNEGKDHANGGDMNAVGMRLKNGVWTQKEPILRTPTVDHWISAADIIDGVQAICRRDDSTGDYRLYMRHLSERFELTNLINAGGAQGADQFSINFADLPSAYEMMGAREAMTAIFSSVDTIAGQNINGERTVTFINGTRIQWAAGGNFSAETLLAGGEFSVTFAESDWIECNIDATTIGQAVVNEWVAGGGASGVVNLHSMAGVEKDAGTFYVGVSGGDVNVGIAKIFRPFDTNSNATVSYVKQLSTVADLAEPTVWRDPANGNLYGFCRTQSFTEGPAFWWSGDDLATAATVTRGPIGALVQSPIPLVGVGDYLYALSSGSRSGNVQVIGDVPATVNMYLGKALKSEAESTGWDAFTWTVIDTVQFANQYFGAANAVGVGSLTVLDDKTLLAGYGGEIVGATSVAGSPTTKTQVFALKIDISDFEPLGRDRVQADRVHNPIDLYWFITGHPAVATGNIVTFQTERLGIGPVCYSTSTGYFTAPETGLYELSFQVTYEDGTAGEKFCEIVDDGGTNLLGGLLVGIDSNIGLSANETHGIGSAAVFLRENQKAGLKVTAANGTRNSTTRAYLYIKKLT